MSLFYAHHITLTGDIPPTTHHIHFADTWNSITMENSIVWDTISPAVCDVSWQTWVDGVGYVAHPVGMHHIVATCFNVSNDVVGTFTLDKDLQSTGLFSVQEVGAGNHQIPFFAAATYRSLNQNAIPELHGLYIYDSEPSPIFNISWGEGFLNSISLTATTNPYNSEIRAFTEGYLGVAYTQTPQVMTPLFSDASYVTNMSCFNDTGTGAKPGTFTMRLEVTAGTQTEVSDIDVNIFSGVIPYVAYPIAQPTPGQFEFVVDILTSGNTYQIDWIATGSLTNWTIVRDPTAHGSSDGSYITEDLIAGFSDMPRERSFFIATPNEFAVGTSETFTLSMTPYINDPATMTNSFSEDIGPQTPVTVDITIVG